MSKDQSLGITLITGRDFSIAFRGRSFQEVVLRGSGLRSPFLCRLGILGNEA